LFNVHPDFYPSRIPDRGVKKAPDPGSATRLKSSISNYRFEKILNLEEGLVEAGLELV
jgi:hypothetical protein